MAEAARPASAGPSAAREAFLVFLSLAAGQILGLVSLSLTSAYLGLESFGRYGLCLVDFGVFANLANFALPVASVPLAVRLGFTREAFAVAAYARLWITLLALCGYLVFEAAFRSDPEAVAAGRLLALAVLCNPQQLEWWSVARRSFADLILHRVVGGMVTLALVLWWVRGSPGLVSAAGAYAAGLAAGFLVLALRSGRSLRAGGRFGFRGPGDPAVQGLWRTSLPVALTGISDVLYLPLGYYAFRIVQGEGVLLGAYGTAHRLALAASLAVSSLFVILLPRFSAPPPGDGTESSRAADLARRLDRYSLGLWAALLAVPFLARPVLRLLFPGTDWTPDALDFAAWTLSCMAASTALHLLRMGPLTLALAAGKSWLFAGFFFLGGAANLAALWAGAHLADPRFLPAWSLAADAVCTGCWLWHLRRERPLTAAWRLLVLAGGAGLYLIWAARFA
jgi:O-antigen/teichoic acid export membrane protein